MMKYGLKNCVITVRRRPSPLNGFNYLPVTLVPPMLRCPTSPRRHAEFSCFMSEERRTPFGGASRRAWFPGLCTAVVASLESKAA